MCALNVSEQRKDREPLTVRASMAKQVHIKRHCGPKNRIKGVGGGQTHTHTGFLHANEGRMTAPPTTPPRSEQPLTDLCHLLAACYASQAANARSQCR